MSFKHKPTQWLERITTALIVMTLVLIGVNRSVAATNSVGTTNSVAATNSMGSQLYDEYSAPAKIAPNSKPIKKYAKSNAYKSSRANNLFPAAKNKAKSASMAKVATRASIDSEIMNETSALQKTAKAQPKKNSATLVAANTTGQKGLRYLKAQGPQNTYAMTTPASQNTTAVPLVQANDVSTTSAKASDVAAPAESPFSGGVNFTMGHDNNIDPNKIGVAGTFFEVDPTVAFKSGTWSGSFGGSMKDFSNQAISDTNKTNEVTANLAWAPKLSDMVTLTSAIDGKYHDEMWPDYINGKDTNTYDHGMPIRYTTGKLTEKLGFDFGSGFTTDIGGYYAHQENSNKYSDWAADILDPRLATQSFNEYQAFGKVGLAVGSNVELAGRPSITERDYTEREARQPDGSGGGNLISAPNKKLLTSEFAFDVNFKFLGSSVGPTVMVGQVSDEVNAAENASYYGAGLKGDLLIVESLKLTISPSVIYKHANFDNWTNAVTTAGAKRVDDDIDTGVASKMMFTKNIGLGVGYAYSNHRSNFADTSENYKEEVISTTAIFTF